MSDHGSGPRAIADSTVDITDMYVFPSPDRPGALVLVLNVFPFAGPTARFSDVVDYRLRIRPVTASDSPGTGAPFAVRDKEYVFSCRFTAPAGGDGRGEHEQQGTCTAPNGETVSFRVDDEGGVTGETLRVFVGRRMDPFFFDGPAVIQSLMTGKLAFTNPGNSTVYRQNVLSIVIEFEVATVLAGDGPLFAVVGETAMASAPGIRLERYGRPDVKNVVMFWKGFDPVNRDLEIRDLYNQEDAFDLGPAYLGAYHSRMNANLTFWDGIDGKADWPLDADGSHPLTELLLADFMVVDVSKPFTDHGFFEIEQAMLTGAAHTTCGGRALNDDCMETFMTVFVNGGHGPRISDGVDQPAVPASRAFPYLVPPEPNPPTPNLPALGPSRDEAER